MRPSSSSLLMASARISRSLRSEKERTSSSPDLFRTYLNKLGAGARGALSKHRALADRGRERALVEVIELAADRHAMSEAGGLYLEMRDEVGDVMRGRLGIDGGVDGEGHLAPLAFSAAGDERLEVDILRPDPVERRQCAAEHVIAGAYRPGALQGPKISDGLDNHQHAWIAPRVAADRAGIKRIDIAALRADEDFLARGLHCIGEGRQKFLALTDEVQCGAARRART